MRTVLDKIKAEHAEFEARQVRERHDQARAESEARSSRVAPAVKRLRSAVLSLLAEELGEDALPALNEFGFNADEVLLDRPDEPTAYVELLREGFAPIGMSFGREDWTPKTLWRERYGVRIEGHFYVAGVYTDSEGKIQGSDEADNWLIVASFGEAVTLAERVWQIEVGRRENQAARPTATDFGGDAFPCESTPGMTLRDYFAGQALVRFMCNSSIPDLLGKGFRPDGAADACVLIADAMIERLKTK